MHTAALMMTREVAADDYFYAGHEAPAGDYLLMDTNREIHLTQQDILPATCDGHIGIYVRRIPRWAEQQREGQKGA